jgi:hypothetical protein
MSYKSCFMFFNTFVCNMFYLLYPFGRYHIFVLWSGNYLPYIILCNGLVFFCHGIHPFFLLKSFFKESMFLFYEITHQDHITGEWIRFLSLSHGSFWGTILLPILNKFPCPSWISLVRDHHLGRFLIFYHIMIFWNLIIMGNCNLFHRFCSSRSYMLFFIYFFKMTFP